MEIKSFLGKSEEERRKERREELKNDVMYMVLVMVNALLFAGLSYLAVVGLWFLLGGEK